MVLTRNKKLILPRKPTEREKYVAGVLCRGRGNRDSIMKRMPSPVKANLKGVIADACRRHGCHPSDLVWRMDRSGVLHVRCTNLGRVG